ncbi:hypothetical protein SSS_03243 [Sarcoptes scabiei]|uniref:Uncharacterized protein n=1 Tax=Sarcoptes scabiei TaxID=52283 RepID=A0A132AGW3_SARSC|nr:hypothetical protein SSS_03243 [Sarcoptes scabiei]KPM10049.1 hypothetical protein QR98_0085960 [Sarcoptes scabiei]UXI20266.1 Exocyst complex component 1 [Sarcoptes scabiei]
MLKPSSIFFRKSGKKIFTKAFVAAHKDFGVTIKEIVDWIKLALYFEDPTHSISKGILMCNYAPIYPELFQTGVCLFGFGTNMHRIAALSKHIEHEYIVEGILGQETLDNYSGSSVIKMNDHSHITEDLIVANIKKFIGLIEQKNPVKVAQKTSQSIRKSINVDEIYGSEPSDRSEENSQLNFEGIIRTKECYDIELLSLKDRLIKFRIISDGLFSCRAFIRDLGLSLHCPSSLHSLHLNRMGPIRSNQTLLKHELHYNQLVNCADEITQICMDYFAKLREQYPLATNRHRRI